MKAAIVYEKGTKPVYGDIAEPALKAGYQLIHVEASALSQLAKHRAEGTHYSSSTQFPFIAGVDGIGRNTQGERIYFLFPESPQGSMAEQVTVPASQCVIIPDSLDAAAAAAIANPAMSSWAALTLRANIQLGDTVLINGATGTSGTLAIQIAKYLGAKKVIVSGRNREKLNELLSQGADIAVVADDLQKEMPALFQQGVDIVLDYLWGNSALAILNAAVNVTIKPIQYVQIGSISGEEISLNSKILRSSDLMLMGSGIGSVSLENLVRCAGEFLNAYEKYPFNIPYRTTPLCDLEQAWNNDDSRCRTVFTL